jgi:hypothetical protein
MELTFNITFYILGIALALVPLIFSKFKNKQWYKITMPTIIVLLIITGIYKTTKDFFSNKDTTSHISSLDSNVNKLVLFKRQDSLFMKKLNDIGIEKDSTTNSPKINKTVFTTYIKSIDHSNLYIGTH